VGRSEQNDAGTLEKADLKGDPNIGCEKAESRIG
jgi:hypothetical protein